MVRGSARRTPLGQIAAVTDRPRPRRVLVLGAGFIGSHIVCKLVAAGHHVDVLTRSEPSAALAGLLAGATVIVGDPTNLAGATALIAQADHVVYAIGSSSPAESHLDPVADVSLVVAPVIRLLEILRLRNSTGLTYLSSGGAVYGNLPGPAREDDRTEPISSYGILKRTVEHFARMYACQHGVPIQVLRVSNVYGPGQAATRGQGLVAHLLRSLTEGAPFPVFGAGDNVRDYVHVADVADAVVQLLSLPGGYHVFNLGSGVGHSIREVITLVEEVSGHVVDVESRPDRPFDVRSVVLDISRLAAMIEFRPRTLRDGLLDTWAARGGRTVSPAAAPLLLQVPGAAV